ncbi:MAG: pyruvate ferredoxin oxidoreductase subunit gamma [Actinobacteria bacterium]|nr:pyruvate ferredoxin oxidoreductase subunit gamma [Actinomycetota bacterium]
MEEIRIHGRGGQGNVTASEFLAEAAFAEGYHAQSFPMFGSERHGAPVTAYVRVSDKPVRVRSQIYEPDHVIIQDETLFGGNDVLEGLKEGGLVIVNSEKPEAGIPVPDKYRLVTVPATTLAIDIVGKPIINTIMVGAFAGASNLIRLETLELSVRERYPGELGEKEIVAMNRAFVLVKEQLA